MVLCLTVADITQDMVEVLEVSTYHNHYTINILQDIHIHTADGTITDMATTITVTITTEVIPTGILTLDQFYTLGFIGFGGKQ